MFPFTPSRRRILGVLSGLVLLGVLLTGCASQADGSGEGVLFDEDQAFAYQDSPKGIELMGDADWTLPGFDHSSWFSGSGAFGAKEGEKQDVAEGFSCDVVLNQFESDGDNLPVYYFRTEFDATDADIEDDYLLDIAYDDAVIVYLNGQEIYAGNVPEDGFSKKGYGAATIQEAPHVGTLTIEGDELVAGKNVLAIELHQADKTSSDIYLRVGALRAASQVVVENRDSSVFLGVGGDETEMLITWHGLGDEGIVEVAELTDGSSDFPDDARSFPATAAYQNADGTSTMRATLSELTPGATYQYRIYDDYSYEPSKTQTFTVPDQGDLTFVVVGDPQLADADDPAPMGNFERLFDAVTDGMQPAFVLTLGDQADAADDAALYRALVNSEVFDSIPVAAVVGNHDYGADQYSRYFASPNMSDVGTASTGDMGGDYWFARDGVLFLILNSNVDDPAGHAAFMREAKSAYEARFGEPNWIFAAFHHSLYSVGEHATSSTVATLRESLVPALQEVGVDVVFSGHDHTYTRTFPLKDGQVVSDASSSAEDGDAIVYVTCGSPTATKFYDVAEGGFDYAAVVVQDDLPAMTRVDVSDTTLTTSTYELADDGETRLIDQFTLTKPNP